MVFADFQAEISIRTVVVTCPDNGRGGAAMPPGDDEAWMNTALMRHDALTGIEGPNITGAYAFHWTGAVSDDEALFQSVKILKELY